MAHRLLKLELAEAARAAGWIADLEMSGPGGAWRADVLASCAGRRVALEAQLAAITSADIIGRTQHMSSDGVEACWFSNRDRIPWLGVVPSARVARREEALVVVEPLARFAGTFWAPESSLPLGHFVRRLLTSQLVCHAPRTPQLHVVQRVAVLWAAPESVLAEEEQVRARERRLDADREERELVARRRHARQQAALAEGAARSDLTRGALARHSAGLPGIGEAIAQLADFHGARVTVGWSVGDSRYASGVPLVDDDGTLLAVYDPLPRPASYSTYLEDVGVPILFPTEERRMDFERSRPRG
ncbi:competence protein CoiA family protein [Actinacidiphila glaucinigra]|uniref:competence protein CoiA family protein n=1 Tax=Actinacidiphila glaucinigra TaxID=235986 RepID=UPI0035DFCA4F